VIPVEQLIKEQFNGHAALRQRRPGIFQLHAPLFHEDGDMVDIFLSEHANGDSKVRVSDEGMTLMRLSYAYDINTESRQRVFQRMLADNGVAFENGCLYLDTASENTYPAVLQFAQTIAKVSSMEYFRREVIQSMFYELLEELILDKLARFNPRKQALPISDQDAYEVDWQFDIRPKPIFLFGVKDRTKALLTTIACQAFTQRKLSYRSVVVHDDSEALSRKDRVRLTNASDKQFTSLDEFRENGPDFFDREAA
jgi:hypothetical protein